MSDVTDVAPLKGQVWYARDYPVLLAAVQACQESPHGLTQTSELAQRTGISQEDVVAAVANLGERYLHIREESSLAERDFIIRGATAEGLIAANVWPSPDALAGRMVTAIEQAIETTPADSPRAGKLTALLNAARELSVGTASNVLGGLLYRVMTGM